MFGWLFVVFFFFNSGGGDGPRPPGIRGCESCEIQFISGLGEMIDNGLSTTLCSWISLSLVKDRAYNYFGYTPRSRISGHIVIVFSTFFEELPYCFPPL